jgi:hypothetical protein
MMAATETSLVHEEAGKESHSKVSWLATSYSPRLPGYHPVVVTEGHLAAFVSLTVAGLRRTFTVFPSKASLVVE